MKRLASIILILFVEILYPNHFFSNAGDLLIKSLDKYIKKESALF